MVLTRRKFLQLAFLGAAGALASRWILGRWPSPRTASLTLIPAPDYENIPFELLKRSIPVAEREKIQGRRVVLKPNMVEFDEGRPVNTDPRLLEAAISVFGSLGASEIIVAEGPGHRRDTEYLLHASGYRQVLRATGVRFVDLNLDETRAVPNAGGRTSLRVLHLPRTVTDADYLVSVPKMKTHHWVGVTLSLKNLFGIMPGVKYGWPKNALHWQGIEKSIVDIADTVPPDLAIVDGVVGMQGNGPLHGKAVPSGIIVVGAQMASVDATCARLMGVRPERVGYLRKARRHGPLSAHAIRAVGARLEDHRRLYDLTPRFRHLRA